MCGISGYLSPKGYVQENVCQKMADALIHRGPDDEGIWIDQDVGIVLGHRRLAIQDLSLSGHQPMVSLNGRYVIAYNGEIYNFRKLQQELEGTGYSFRGFSDTEVLLVSIECWGVEKALKKLVGMFAFSLWDRKERVLTLARDRMGEKPLYYGWQNEVLIFASEPKALREHPDWRGEINRDALALFLRHNYIPAPHSIYRGIYKLMPGTFIQIKTFNSQFKVGELPDSVPYWNAKDVVAEGVSNPLSVSDIDAIDSLDELLRECVRDKMISDVPLGAFLSGGVDSSTIVAIMQQESERPIKTFSIGFYEEDFDEAKYAKAVASHLCTEHTEMYVTPRKAMDAIPKLPILYDEPFSDSSQIPTFLLSEITKQHVTVALSGDGGDELFGGYSRYFLGQSLWNKFSKVPYGMRSLVSHVITKVPPKSWDSIGMIAGKFVSALRERAGDKIHKFAGILSSESSEDMYCRFVSHWQDPTDVVLNSKEPKTALIGFNNLGFLNNFTQKMMFLDTISYLPDDILVKVDRASMGVSLETRVPFLDHRIIEYVWKLPHSMKIRNGQGKWILRQVLEKYVPKNLINRPKMGFGIPIDAWLRGSLRDWAETLLNESRLRQENYFNTAQIREKWNEHLSGKRNWQYHLWDVLMFQAWLEENN